MPTSTLSEKRFLIRIQLRLLLWYFIAFLAFEGAIVGGTYFVLKRSVMKTAYHDIQEEWTQKIPEVLDEIKLDNTTQYKQPKIDNNPEVIATWTVNEKGDPLSEDLALVSVSGTLKPLFASLTKEISHTDPSPVWYMDHIGTVPVLMGVQPLFQQDHYVGAILSAYSLLSIYHTMYTLMRIDIIVGLTSILIILPIIYLLSRKSLQPIRFALKKQHNFVNDASHELRTPLTILRGTLELAKEEKDSLTMHNDIIECLKEVDYISQLVGDLATLARLESAVAPLHLDHIDLTHIINETIHSLQPLALPKKIMLHFNENDPHIYLFADPTRLRQLLFIILENAIKFSNPMSEIHITLKKNKTEAILSVSDSGIGIDVKDLPHIFGRFYRTSQAEQLSPGSGLGLSIAAWIVNEHHGRMEVSSLVNIGTTFDIFLPLKNKNGLET